MHRMRPAAGFRTRFAYTERAHLALLQEPRHGADRVFDRHRRIDAVLVIKIDHVDAEALEARLAGGKNKFRTTIGKFAAAATEIAEFGRQHDLIAPALDGFAHQRLVVPGAVSVGGVEESDAAIERVANKHHAIVVAARAVYPGERHATKTDRRHRDAGGAEAAAWQLLRFVHVSSFQLSSAPRRARGASTARSQTTGSPSPQPPRRLARPSGRDRRRPRPPRSRRRLAAPSPSARRRCRRDPEMGSARRPWSMAARNRCRR